MTKVSAVPSRLIAEDPSTPESATEIHSRMAADAQQLYKLARMPRPLFPWVLLYVLPRQQETASGIQIVEMVNKVALEGIVLATWQPRADPRPMKSELEPGDHVLFPHFAGQPVSGLDDKRYRMVRERDWHESKQGGIYASLDVEQGDSIVNALADFLVAGDPEEHQADLAARICERYILIDRQTQSVTLSGE